MNKDFEFKQIGKKIYNRTVNGPIENHYFILYEIYNDNEPILNEESVEFVRMTIEEIREMLKQNPENFGGAFHFVANSFYGGVLV